MNQTYSISGKLLDVITGEIYPAQVTVQQTKIIQIERLSEAPDQLILPGLIDAHVHIESSMLIPSEFARLAVVHGTVATVSDPHEIANVLGLAGVEYMLKNSKRVPFKFYFGAPSCVPATEFETAGATIDSEAVARLLDNPEIKYLSEMMNFPGVLNSDSEVLKKIAAAHARNKPVDGHAPGLRGIDAIRYAQAGISSDHECTTIEEAREKIAAGMKIIIREGSAARNFDALIELLHESPDRVMFCCDDKHPDELVRYHIDELVRRAIRYGIPAITAIRAATLNPVKHYGLEVGLLQVGDPADFIVVKSLENFKVLRTFIAGVEVAAHGQTLIPQVTETAVNNFCCDAITSNDIKLEISGETIRVIEVLDGQLITKEINFKPQTKNFSGNCEQDILKIVVINRYKKATPAVAFVKNFGLKRGAIASSVAHDSHNIIAVGTSDAEISSVVNLIIESQGGIGLVDQELKKILALPVAGLMSNQDGYLVARNYEELDAVAKSLGSQLRAPFMSLSFLALLVIPELKLSDLGLFDGKNFKFTAVSH